MKRLFDDIEGVYFIGIGGIGMSALAEYFIRKNISVAGYDRTNTAITEMLIAQGCEISFEDDAETIPERFRTNRDGLLVVYTPAIPADNNIFLYFKDNGFKLNKRSEILGQISQVTDAVAVGGTHGKTTVSTMTAHILRCSGIDCSAFLGGISKNYGSNLLVGESKMAVMEADEFDRSFHRLSPMNALITATDADHLDIYGTTENMLEGYSVFCEKIRKGGTLIINKKVVGKIRVPENVKCYTYGMEKDVDYRCFDVRFKGDSYTFNIMTPEGAINNIVFNFLGMTNVENFTAAVALALNSGATEEGIRKAAETFLGVKRRFDVRIDVPGLTYVDDYAHHPEEIKSCINSLLGYYGDRRITGVFQPHLYSRTLEHYDGFAEVLDKLDEVILLPIYPAREKPIPGVSSELILNHMKLANKRLVAKEDLLDTLNVSNLDVLVTIGAGNIDTLVAPIEEKLRRERGI